MVSGAQQLSIYHHVLDPCDSAIVEDPGHPGALAAFKAAGANLISIGVDSKGIVIEKNSPLTRGRVWHVSVPQTNIFSAELCLCEGD